MSEEMQYRDPRRMVRRLQNLGRELQGLNEDAAVKALVYANDRLGNELAILRLHLMLESDQEQDEEQNQEAGDG